ncbi:hypothetical protein Tco_0989219 [Tanacetum coccineum]|uniref:Uncharacterized protein n=1 Tax=Tanacetum coccineum TaxID=301880 RepID=A0ABQ5EU56_9ASTR
MCQDVMICVMNSTAVFDDVNVEMQSSESCVKYLDLDAELLNKQNAYNDLQNVANLLSKNERLQKEIEHLKKIYKDQFDLIKKTRALSKEHGDSLIAQLNSKSMENANLKCQIQDKDYLKHTQEQADIPRGIVKQAKATQPLDNALDFACCPDCSLVSGLRMSKTLSREHS